MSDRCFSAAFMIWPLFCVHLLFHLFPFWCENSPWKHSLRKHGIDNLYDINQNTNRQPFRMSSHDYQIILERNLNSNRDSAKKIFKSRSSPKREVPIIKVRWSNKQTEWRCRIDSCGDEEATQTKNEIGFFLPECVLQFDRFCRSVIVLNNKMRMNYAYVDWKYWKWIDPFQFDRQPYVDSLIISNWLHFYRVGEKKQQKKNKLWLTKLILLFQSLCRLIR